jgi:tRNA(Arg) A34 adenosine deaminase TadA
MTNSSELDENRFAHFTDEMNIELLLRANAVGQRARDNGDEPFGCLLADIDGNVIYEGECQVRRDNDPTQHGEVVMVKGAVKKFGAEYLANCSAYVSGGPCAMCSGTIYWSGIGRLVYAINIEDEENRKALESGSNPMLHTSFLDVFASGTRKVVIDGPYPELQDTIMKRFEGYEF